MTLTQKKRILDSIILRENEVETRNKFRSWPKLFGIPPIESIDWLTGY